MPTAQRITFVLDDLFTPETREMSDEVLGYLLKALTDLDVLYLKAHPETPLIYDSGVVYQEEPPGAEDWANIPMILKLGWGDCLPLDTLVLNDEYTAVPFSTLCVGDKIIAGDGQMSTVLEACVTEEKPILALRLENGRTLRCSKDHKSFMADGTSLRASDMSVGMRLKTPSGKRRKTAEVGILSIREEAPQLVGDIRTDTGFFYLPESDIITSNCEDLACWRAAELQVRGNLNARAGFTKQTQPDGTTLYHITVLLPDGRIEDPSRQLGMR